MVSTYHQDVFPPASFNSQKKQAPRGFLGKGLLWMDIFLMSLSRDQASVHSQTESLPGKPDRSEGATMVCCHCHLVDYKGDWFSTNFHLNVAFCSKCPLAVDCVPHGEDPHLFSNTSLLHSQFTYNSDRVFFQETHISLFDLGASVRIFLILLWHSESVNVFHICLMLFRDIYDHLLVTQGKECRNFFLNRQESIHMRKQIALNMCFLRQ